VLALERGGTTTVTIAAAFSQANRSENGPVVVIAGEPVAPARMMTRKYFMPYPCTHGTAVE